MSNAERGKGILLESGTNEVEFLRFGCAGQSYGINVAKVSQILLFKPELLTKVPMRPRSMLGTVDYRGRSIPVIDLAEYLELPLPDQDKQRLLLVTQFNQHVTGFVVDNVDGIVRCSWTEFVPLEDQVFGDGGSNVVGTVTVADVLMLILDVEVILGTLIPTSSISQYSDKVAKSASLDRSKIRVLYCEDSPTVQKILIKTLREAGFEKIEVFPNGAEGYERIKSIGANGVDIILSDIEMPRMDGLALCKAVRELSDFKSTPFVFFSSMVDDQMKRKCEQVGGQAAFAKPEVQLIVDCIDRLMSA